MKQMTMHNFKFLCSLLLITLLLTNSTQASPYTISDDSQNVDSFIQHNLALERYDLVMFWATFCGPCKRDFKKIAQLMQDNPDIHMTILGVVIDGEENPELTESLVQQHQLDYAHVLTNFEAAAVYHQQAADKNLIGTPSYLLYDHSNELVADHPSMIDLDALLMLVED
jgi:thiol-disulfide isomerase/thioredoxin